VGSKEGIGEEGGPWGGQVNHVVIGAGQVREGEGGMLCLTRWEGKRAIQESPKWENKIIFHKNHRLETQRIRSPRGV